MEAVRDAGYVARALQVSHAFHTKIVAPASESLASVLRGMNLKPPTVPDHRQRDRRVLSRWARGSFPR